MNIFLGTALLAKDKTNDKLVVIKSIPTTKKSELAEAKAEAEVIVIGVPCPIREICQSVIPVPIGTIFALLAHLIVCFDHAASQNVGSSQHYLLYCEFQ